jgi:dolichol-phosphate mannosyltransferase
MLATLREENLDVVIGSRHVAGGSLGNWDIRRAMFSKFATRLARLVVTADLADPMSGFFILSRPAFEQTVRRLSGQGFKILVDLFASTPVPYRFKEVPYTFRTRLHGESKLDGLIAWQYIMLLLDKSIGRFVPARFVVFCAVGGSGVISHLLVLALTLKLFSSFPLAQFVATGVAMTGNFVLNNILTYRDKQLAGKRLVSGLLRFYAICSVGILANVGIASVAFAQNYTWWISGLAGATIGVVWNYSVSSIFTWNDK